MSDQEKEEIRAEVEAYQTRIQALGDIRHAFIGGRLDESLRRLFWYRCGPPSEEELKDPGAVLAAVANVLREGTAEDWRWLDHGVVAPLAEELPMFGAQAAVWHGFYLEEREMEDNRRKVLSEEENRILEIAGKVLPVHGFELAGGTALAAAYLGHRRAKDLEFLTPEKSVVPGPDALKGALGKARWNVSVESSSPTFARMLVGERPTKVEMSLDTRPRLAPSEVQLMGMPVASLEDLAAAKVLRVFRGSPLEDFVDVHVLMRTHYDLSELVGMASRKAPEFDVGWLAKDLGWVARPRPREISMLIPFDFERMQEDLLAASRRLIRKALGKP